MASTVQILRTVRELLADPRRWVQGYWGAYRDDRGVVHPHTGSIKHHASNCWCLGQAISNAILMHMNAAGQQTDGKLVTSFTELRSEVERELLVTLLADGINVSAVYIWNDDRSTAHADIVRALDKTLDRLAPHAA